MAKHIEPVVVIGLGRFGYALALELTRLGTEVMAIDSSEVAVQQLTGRISQLVAADATDAEVLRELGVANFMRAFVAIGDDREASILVTTILSEFGIGDIWAKAMNEQHARILSRVGAHHVILPEQETGTRAAHLVSGGILDYFEIDKHWVVGRVRPPRAVVGRSLRDVNLQQDYGVAVVAMKPEHSSHFEHVNGDTVLTYGMQLLVSGAPDDVEAFAAEA